jgi:hypothetical protein
MTSAQYAAVLQNAQFIIHVMMPRVADQKSIVRFSVD